MPKVNNNISIESPNSDSYKKIKILTYYLFKCAIIYESLNCFSL